MKHLFSWFAKTWWNDFFPMETCLDRKRRGRLIPEVNDEHGTMTVCGEWWWMGRTREDGSKGTKTGIHLLSPPMTVPSKLFFFLPLNGLFSPVCPMNYVNVYGIPFSRGQRKKRLKLEKCLLLTFFSSLRCLWTTFHVGSVGLGFSSAAMWKDDGGCWVGGGGGSGHNDIYEELRRQAGKECLPCCWTAWHWLMRERKTESEKRENKKRGVALV